MKEKVGIITFHAAHNCGSFLQSYAMQNVLKKLGYDAELIDYSSEGQRDMYSVFSKKKDWRKKIKNIVYFPHKKTLERHRKNYQDFIKNNLKVSDKKYLSVEELENMPDNQYDIYLAGSDQVWNITIPDASEAYFLSFTNNKRKIAYAPSFGAKNIKELAEDPQKYANYLLKFKDLSIRENNGKKWIKELINKDVEVVLDPTLLLDVDYYNKIMRDSGITGDYIFYYSPRYKKNIDKFVKKLSKKYKLPVIVFNSKEYYFRGLGLKGFKMTYEQDPGIYLHLIKNAKMVITTSFHGTIFSTIYRKKFWVMKNGDMYGTDDRVITLLNQLSMINRLIEPEFYEEFDYNQDLDYSEYERNLEGLRKKSYDFLEKALKD